MLASLKHNSIRDENYDQTMLNDVKSKTYCLQFLSEIDTLPSAEGFWVKTPHLGLPRVVKLGTLSVQLSSLGSKNWVRAGGSFQNKSTAGAQLMVQSETIESLVQAKTWTVDSLVQVQTWAIDSLLQIQTLRSGELVKQFSCLDSIQEKIS